MSAQTASILVGLLVLAAVAAAAYVVVARLRGLEHSAEELEAIRAALAPAAVPEVHGAEVATAFIGSELGVSGDFFLVAKTSDSSVAVVGDVVGHGPKAAQLATFVRARIAAFAANVTDPAELLTLANRALIESPRRDAFVSAVSLRYSPASSELAWAVAGHPAPLRLPDLEALRTPGRTLLLGVDPDLSLSTSRLRLTHGEGVLVYTDGATDVRGGDGATLGETGLTALLRPLAGSDARRVVEGAERAILDWAASPIKDDLCLLAMRPAGAPRREAMF
jgi:sigma-B regulation protein RsbU (phosphoserine phosphatase)